MIVGLFSDKSFIKILFCRFTISISRFRITTHFPGNLPEFSRKFFGNFSENSYFPTYPPYPPPIPLTPTQPPDTRTHSELQTQFSRKFVFPPMTRFFPTGFTYFHYLHVCTVSVCCMHVSTYFNGPTNHTISV